MPLLVGGLLLFFLLHILRELGWRDRIITRLGSVKIYKVVIALLSLLALTLIVTGKSQSEFLMVWEPRFHQRSFSNYLMLPALVLFVAGNFPNSCMLVLLRNPMLMGAMFWGAAHLWSNGDLASLLLFGGFTLWALFKYISLFNHPSASTKSPSLWWDMAAIVIGSILYLLLAFFHGTIFGVGLSFGQ
ncbi:MAG: NnrU family protein [Gammaproteobacteria bacterium]|nr:NnrU family protein [Gammaproteobacteria bacterium]MCY4357721.1 NnrU family protein [Gammaproteobacteria bacterium]